MWTKPKKPAKKRPHEKHRKTPKRYGICLDSLHRLRLDEPFEFVIIDEVEQFLRHFFSDPMVKRGKQDRNFKILREFVRRAKYVVALDADLDYCTTNTLARMVSFPDADGVLRPSKPSYLWINETPSPDRRTIELYESKNHLVDYLLQTIADDNKRCFITSNSKKLIVKLDAVVRKRFGATRRVIMITGDTSGRPEAQDFIANPAARAATYDVIFCSPSLGTGVDITFPDNAQRVDLVVGFCEPGINTHLDFDQQLARVRNPGAIKVWITPRRSNFETHLDVVRHDILRNGLYKDLLDGFDDDGKPRFIKDDPLIELAALVKSAERTSKNNLRGNYVRYKQAQGCTIINVGKNPKRSFDGHAALKLGALLTEEERVARIMAASILTKVETEKVRREIEAGAVVSESTQWSYERTHLELFYRAEATPELILLDRDGRHRHQVRLFERIARLPPEAMPANKDAPLHDDLSYIGDAGHDLAPALVQVLRTTPVWREHPHTRIPHPEGEAEIERGRFIPPSDAWLQARDGRVAGSFDPKAVIETGDLQAFARFVHDNKKPLETLLDIEVRSDIRRKPVQQLGRVLGVVGLALTQVDTQKIAGRKIRSYSLDASAFSMMAEIVGRRERMKGWAFLADRYGSDIDPSDQDDFSDTEAEIARTKEFLQATTRTFQKEE